MFKVILSIIANQLSLVNQKMKDIVYLWYFYNLFLCWTDIPINYKKFSQIMTTFWRHWQQLMFICIRSLPNLSHNQ